MNLSSKSNLLMRGLHNKKVSIFCNSVTCINWWHYQNPGKFLVHVWTMKYYVIICHWNKVFLTQCKFSSHSHLIINWLQTKKKHFVIKAVPTSNPKFFTPCFLPGIQRESKYKQTKTSKFTQISPPPHT